MSASNPALRKRPSEARKPWPKLWTEGNGIEQETFVEIADLCEGSTLAALALLTLRLAVNDFRDGDPEAADFLSSPGVTALCVGLGLDPDEFKARLRAIEPAAPDSSACDGMAGFSRLTPREREVSRLHTLGAKDRDIADKLALRMGSVHSYVKQIFSKLSIHDRHELRSLPLLSADRVPPAAP